MKSLSNTFLAALLAIGLTIAVVGFLHVPFGKALEAWMGDEMLMWRYDLLKQMKSAPKTDSHLLLVAIDQRSVNDLGRWPFPRAIHGQFFGVLAPENPKVVALDTLFTEKIAPSPAIPPAVIPAPSLTPDLSNPPSPDTAAPPADADSQLQPDDQALVDATKLLPCLVTAALGDPDSGSNLKDGDTLPTRPLLNIVGDKNRLLTYPFALVPFAELRKVSYFGFADTSEKGFLRTMPLVVQIGSQVFPSFDLQILMQYLGVDPDHVVVDVGHEITLTTPAGTVTRIPINDAGEFLINYRARSEDFPAIGYSVLGKDLADKANNHTPEEHASLLDLKNKIVMVGVTLSGTDDGATPIEPYAPRVITQLNVLNNILQGDYLSEVSPGVWVPLYALFLFALACGLLRVGISPMILMGLTSMVLLSDVVFATLWFGNALMPILAPELGVLVLTGCVPIRRYFGSEREKIRIKNILRANLSDKVMNRMLEHPDNVKLGGAKQEITIMFCDLRNFTEYCDHRDPQEVMESLNAYMEEMTQVIFKHDGTVDKYIGDCIMAFWNAPQPQADHAERAVSCAIEMREALAHFKSDESALNRESFECAIGIHTGEALVGNLGSSHKRTYTAMGSTVNMASRIESLTRQLNEHILISSDVVRQLQARFPLVDRGDVMVTGFAEPIHVYAVSTSEKISPPREKEMAPVDTPTPKPILKEARQPMWRMAPLPEDVEQDS
jgi:adenylate cyclase